MRIGIVGGGVLGLILAYLLGRRGVRVTLLEGKGQVGGLIDHVQVDGTWIDKYYHCILSGDADLLALIDELDLSDRVRFTETRQGFYHDRRLYPMSNGKDFLLFPPLTLVERLRLGLTILGALRVNDWHALEEVAVEDWLVGLGGRGTFEKIWKPLLRAKFDGHYQRTPATYIWSRLKRTSSTRTSAGQKERMGYFVGSYKVFIDRLVERIRANGSSIRTNARVRQILVDGGRVSGLLVDEERLAFDAVIATTPVPVLRELVPEAWRAPLALPASSEYLGVICGLMLLDRPLTPYYTLYIADDRIPFTGVIETTNLIDPNDVGGHHLIYLPKYVTPASPYRGATDEDLRALYLTHLKAMFPAFQESWVRRVFVFRERFVEPLHQIGRPRPTLPTTTALPGLFVVNNGQIYPDLTNCQASVRHALGALPTLLNGAAAGAPPALAAAVQATRGVTR